MTKVPKKYCCQWDPNPHLLAIVGGVADECYSSEPSKKALITGLVGMLILVFKYRASNFEF